MLRMAAGISTLPRERLTGDLSDPALAHVSDDGAGTVIPFAHIKELGQHWPDFVGAEHIHLGAQECLKGVKYDHHGLALLDGRLHLRAVKGQSGGIGEEIALIQIATVRFDTTAQDGQVILHRQNEHGARAFNGDV